MILRLTPAAKADIAEARRWYRRQARGLDAEFLRSVEACLASIDRLPEGYPVIRGRVRRAVLRRFPCGICDLADQAAIVVIAVYHTSRDPGPLQARLRSS